MSRELDTLAAELEGKHISVFVGPTGSGKSTIINSIFKKLSQDEDGEFQVKDPVMYAGREMFKARTGTGVTDVPGYCPLDRTKKITYIVDSAGYGDSCKIKEYPN